ncbi:hypothetical protein [Nitrobacter winogradskyi]|uniref:Uncharacterized protein n=2 Tax=Nitrobacter winogradskyi TaxID=913 RepID=A0ACC6AGN8_NITWI|nr:hypothetical protein [Nitrobacter winogradskyi]MCP1998771.1 hypothetical protein [Nitrobacter winogradskyi]GEC14304.1 hypothetical protein NWI01_01960 [Nitrobacter winogradskyi]
MKITLDPMPALRAASKAKVNRHFDSLAQPHRDAAYTAKRAMAAATLASGAAPTALQAEADLRGVTARALASLIMSKPDVVTERELHRQKVMAALDGARTPAELDGISKDLTGRNHD